MAGVCATEPVVAEASVASADVAVEDVACAFAFTMVDEVVASASEVVAAASEVVSGVAVVAAVVVAAGVSTLEQDAVAYEYAAAASAALVHALLAQSRMPKRKFELEHRHSLVTGTQPVDVSMLLIHCC